MTDKVCLEREILEDVVETLLSSEVEFCVDWKDFVDKNDVENLTDKVMQKVLDEPLVQLVLAVKPEMKEEIRHKIHSFLEDNAEHAILCDEYDKLEIPLFYADIFNTVCDELDIC
jgi:uncharacterized protein YdhG (YjbR/CyaY superfamily)